MDKIVEEPKNDVRGSIITQKPRRGGGRIWERNEGVKI